MMNPIYEQLWQENYSNICQNQIEIDTNLNNPNDNRRGLTLRFRPPSTILNNIQSFLKTAQKIEPNLYFYPLSDIHLTILTIISCHSNFSIENLKIENYQTIISASFEKLRPPLIHFHGITIAPNAILIKGFTKNDSLNNFRNHLRKRFHNSNFYQTIDKRYRLQTAHLTVIRFPNKLENPSKFAIFLNSQRQVDFGTTSVNSMELVCNDWYQQRNLTKVLGVSLFP